MSTDPGDGAPEPLRPQGAQEREPFVPREAQAAREPLAQREAEAQGEIEQDRRSEFRLIPKALLALAIVGVIVAIRVLYLS